MVAPVGSKLRKVKIVSENGIGTGCSVSDAETGVAIPGAYRFEVTGAVDEIVKAKIYCHPAALNLTALGDVWVKNQYCPCWWCRAKGWFARRRITDGLIKK